MTSLAEFKTNFAGHTVPPELAKLLAFQDEHGFESYSGGFGLLADGKSGLHSWSEDEAFLSKLMPFAQATGTGSIYALWSGGAAKSTSEMPVIVFGDEGGVHVIAENVKELLRLLTFDVEPMVDLGGVSFYKDEDEHEPSEAAEEYEAWLQSELGLEPVDDADEIVSAAQLKYKKPFDAWMKTFVPDHGEE